MNTQYDPNDEGNAIHGLRLIFGLWLIGMVAIGGLIGIIIWIGRYL